MTVGYGWEFSSLSCEATYDTFNQIKIIFPSLYHAYSLQK